jgi:superfamily I DNA and/or RNA helicase
MAFEYDLRALEQLIPQTQGAFENHLRYMLQVVKTEESKHNFSSIDVHEALLIKSILLHDEDILRLQESSNDSIRTIVITPYLAQALLLKRELKKIKSLRSWDVATAHSFQGQEGDIVIVSTVRTKSVGFTDNSHRLNVALTRAKRILRVVGDVTFFLSLGKASVLGQLARFAKANQIVEVASTTGLWRPPDWQVLQNGSQQ